MPLRSPLPFREALAKIRDKIPTGRPWSSATWAAQETDVRERAFFSAKVENRFFLRRAQLFIQHFLEREREGSTLKAGSMSKFVEEMRAFAIREGMGKAGEANENDVTDIRSETRLRLIFKTQIGQAYGFGGWRQGMEPIVLQAFPAARVVRNPGAREPRPRHVQEEGAVRLKTDHAYWADYMNDRAIGGFQVPWGPYGYNSFIDQSDVPRAEAEERQLIQREEAVKGSGRRLPSLNEKLRVSVAGLSKDDRARLKAELGDIAVMGSKAVRLKTATERDAA